MTLVDRVTTRPGDPGEAVPDQPDQQDQPVPDQPDQQDQPVPDQPDQQDQPDQPSPSRAEPPNQLTASSLRVVQWKDEVVDALGLDPRSMYVEQFWLPVIGPTCTLLLRRTAARFERHGAGFVMDLDDTARSLGLGARQGRNSPFARAVVRCTTFELARWQGPGTLAVRRMMPPLARRFVLRLPVTLQEEHRRWLASVRRPAPSESFEQHRGRARRLALGLVALGEAFDRAEGQLLRWGVHPALVGDALTWARRVRLPGDGLTTSGDGSGGEPDHEVAGVSSPVARLHP
jgi:hypothetical protein